MKDTTALDRKGTDCHRQSTILMCVLIEAISCSLVSFVVSLVVFLGFYFGTNKNQMILTKMHDPGSKKTSEQDLGSKKTCQSRSVLWGVSYRLRSLSDKDTH